MSPKLESPPLLPSSSLESSVLPSSVSASWQPIRDGLCALRQMVRASLHVQAIIGWHLHTLKKQHAVAPGGDPLQRTATWSKILEAETRGPNGEPGLAIRTADRFIRLYESSVAKLKRLKPKKGIALPIPRENALSILTTSSPADLPADQREAIQDIVASLCDGETQSSLMEELGILKRRVMPAGPGGRPDKKPETTIGEQAQLFFESILASVSQVRCDHGYKNLLAALPPEGEGVSLATLEAETRALLADIEDVRQSSAKPARGRTIR